MAAHIAFTGIFRIVLIPLPVATVVIWFLKYMEKVCLPVRQVGRNPENPGLRSSKKNYVPVVQMIEIIESGLCNCLTSVAKDTMVMEICMKNK